MLRNAIRRFLGAAACQSWGLDPPGGRWFARPSWPGPKAGYSVAGTILYSCQTSSAFEASLRPSSRTQCLQHPKNRRKTLVASSDASSSSGGEVISSLSNSHGKSAEQLQANAAGFQAFSSSTFLTRTKAVDVVPYRREFFTSQSTPQGPTLKSVSLSVRCAVKHCVRLRTSARHRQACARVFITGWVPISEVYQLCEVHTLYLTLGSQPPTGRPGGSERPVEVSAVDKMQQQAAGCLKDDRRGSCTPGHRVQHPLMRWLLPGIQAQKTVFVTEAVMAKMCGLEVVRGDISGTTEPGDLASILARKKLWCGSTVYVCSLTPAPGHDLLTVTS